MIEAVHPAESHEPEWILGDRSEISEDTEKKDPKTFLKWLRVCDCSAFEYHDPTTWKQFNQHLDPWPFFRNNNARIESD